ncbi:hypothetical protein BDV93DRAFT_506748 [Ceratobasidium sp. AG-I]|nr:hypothetical protein BDV93DRAFT_506748 [Ceratobasidium sp. AG-I]
MCLHTIAPGLIVRWNSSTIVKILLWGAYNVYVPTRQISALVCTPKQAWIIILQHIQVLVVWINSPMAASYVGLVRIAAWISRFVWTEFEVAHESNLSSWKRTLSRPMVTSDGVVGVAEIHVQSLLHSASVCWSLRLEVVMMVRWLPMASVAAFGVDGSAVSKLCATSKLVVLFDIANSMPTAN